MRPSYDSVQANMLPSSWIEDNGQIGSSGVLVELSSVLLNHFSLSVACVNAIIFTGPRSPARVRQSPAESGGLSARVCRTKPDSGRTGTIYYQNRKFFLSNIIDPSWLIINLKQSCD